MEFGPSSWRTPETGMQREWLLTNGLGGYASTALTGANARRYHGLLIAAPANRERHLVLSQISEAVVDRGQFSTLLAFHTREQYYRGEEYLTDFWWTGMPVWRYRIGRLSLEKQVVLVHEKNRVIIRYRVRNGSHPVSLHLSPLVNFRNHHFLSYNQYVQFQTEFDGRRMSVHPFGSTDVIRIDSTDGNMVRRDRSWFYNMDYPLDRQRGQPATEDHFLPGTYEIALEPGAVRTITLSVSLNEPFEPLDGDAAIRAELNRLQSLPLGRHPDPFVRSLSQAADQFVIHRTADTGREEGPGKAPGVQLLLDPGLFRHDTHRSPWGVSCGPSGPVTPSQTTNNANGARAPSVSIIAGYPWIGPWGRDSLIALPGLLLATGRHREAGQLLLQMAQRVEKGMLPNPLLPDRRAGADSYTPGESAGNGVQGVSRISRIEKAIDGPLWLFEAAWRVLEATGDLQTIRLLMPVLEEIVQLHASSRIEGVFCESDGLLRVTDGLEPRSWMNARVGNWIVTPRAGKPVEINALWYNALQVLAGLRERIPEYAKEKEHSHEALKDPRAFAGKLRLQFEMLFWNHETQCLNDVCGADTVDASIRPNQVIACSLSFPVLEGDKARCAMETVFQSLHTPLGLRSLSVTDDRFKGQYAGDVYAREGAMHQGTVWPWLLGPFATAWRRTHLHDADLEAFLRSLFDPVKDHLKDGCLGSVTELADGLFPHEPRGCVSQAWSVAEILRGYLEEVVGHSAIQLSLVDPE